MKPNNRHIERGTNWLLVRARAIARSRFSIIFVVLFLCSTVLIANTFFSKRGRDREGLTLLKDVFNARRSIQSRVVGFEYAPLLSTRGAGERPAPNNPALDRAERLLLDAVYYAPDANSHHALGVFQLLNKRFDKAIEEFEEALTYEPQNAKLHSDLGAALFETGKAELAKEKLQSKFTGKPVEYMSRGIEHLHKAVASDASLGEAFFNLGLIQAELGLRFSARDTFSKYLGLDSDSSWAHEAREIVSVLNEKDRTAALSQQGLLADFLDAFEEKDEQRAWRLICENRSPLNGKYVSDLLIDDYIDQALAGKEEARHSLAALSFLAELEVSRADEHYSARLSEYYRTRSRDEFARLRRARDLVRRGHDLYVLDKENEAIAAYTAAKSEFDRLNDGCESLSAEYRIAYCESESRSTANSFPVFKRLSSLSEKRKFRLLHIRSLLGIASGEFSRKAYSEAIKYGLHSIEIATQVGDECTAFASLDSTMEFYRAVKNDKRVLACIQNNLEYASSPSINQLHSFVHYSRVASALLSAGYLDASLEFRREASTYLVRDVPRDAALYFADLGSTYTRLRQFDDALESLNRAGEEANVVSPEPARNLVLAYVTLHKGYFYRLKGEWGNALACYTDGLKLSEHADFPAFAYEARKGRLSCYIALAEDAMAEGEIIETLKLLEGDRSEILEQEDRNSFFDAEQDVYDLAIDYEYSRRGNPAKAFDYSEQSRSRSLLDLLRRQEPISSGEAVRHGINFREISPALTLPAIQQRLPEHLQVIEYSVLANKILIWVLDSNRFSTTSVDIAQEDLKKKVRAYLNIISQYTGDESGRLSAQSRELFDILVKPVSHLLRRGQSISIVADKVLSNLPFETLISSETQTYLLEDFAFLYSPSSSVLIACNEEAGIRQALDDGRLLGVGNPDFDRSLFKGLSDLPAAQTEIEKIAAYYQRPVVLIGGAARESKVTSEMQRATIIHFAAHSLLDEDSVLRSKILLSKETIRSGQDSDGVLESREIYQTRLPNTRLVVLSSCQSGIDRYYNGEGMMSLARSFMAAGVPTVVASLWEVDSNATADLMVEFHRLMKEGNLSVAEALRNAKLSVLKNQGGRFRHPYFWSAFVATGGEAELVGEAVQG